MEIINNHKKLNVYLLAMDTAMKIFELSKRFPLEERFSLTDQIRRSSRSVCANIAEAFHKGRYEKAFVAKLSDSEAEAAETQVWLGFAFNCKYLNEDLYLSLHQKYNFIIGKLIKMIHSPEKWSF